MGLFKGNKNKKSPADEDVAKQASTQRRSRRVVVPGQAGQQAGQKAAPAGGGTSRVQPGNRAPTPSARTVQRPPTTAPQQPSKPTPSDSSRVGRSVAPPQAPDGLMLGEGNAPAANPTPVRPRSRDPIVDSQPLSFAGDLSSGGQGPARTGDRALLDFLVNKANLITQDLADNARRKAESERVTIDAALVALDAVSEDQLVSALTQECWVPHLRVDKYEIRKKALDTIAREDAVRFSVFPVDKLGSLLTLAMVNPLDTETIRVLEGKTGLDIKKVVATRSEIAQGIEKYYSGQVEAKDTSISFTQDVEPRSVTQMLTNVPVRDELSAPEPDLSMDIEPVIATPPVKKSSDSDIIPEIQDIDDLLTSDEIIAPAIIEPIGIEPLGEDDLEPAAIPDAEIEPLGIRPQTESSDEFDDIGITVPAARASDGIDLGDMDLSLDDTAPIEPAASRPAASALPNLPPAPEFIDVNVPAADPVITRPHVRVEPPKPKALDELGMLPPAPVAKQAPTAPVAPPARVASPALPPVAPAARPAAPAPRPAGAGTAGRPAAQIINLMPVMEEEFQHAITHGKAHLFERWVGLQTRNRIINGIQVEAELDDLLEGLYAAPRRVG